MNVAARIIALLLAVNVLTICVQANGEVSYMSRRSGEIAPEPTVSAITPVKTSKNVTSSSKAESRSGSDEGRRPTGLLAALFGYPDEIEGGEAALSPGYSVEEVSGATKGQGGREAKKAPSALKAQTAAPPKAASPAKSGDKAAKSKPVETPITTEKMDKDVTSTSTTTTTTVDTKETDDVETVNVTSASVINETLIFNDTEASASNVTEVAVLAEPTNVTLSSALNATKTATKNKTTPVSGGRNSGNKREARLPAGSDPQGRRPFRGDDGHKQIQPPANIPQRPAGGGHPLPAGYILWHPVPNPFQIDSPSGEIQPGGADQGLAGSEASRVTVHPPGINRDRPQQFDSMVPHRPFFVQPEFHRHQAHFAPPGSFPITQFSAPPVFAVPHPDGPLPPPNVEGQGHRDRPSEEQRERPRKNKNGRNRKPKGEGKKKQKESSRDQPENRPEQGSEQGPQGHHMQQNNQEMQGHVMLPPLPPQGFPNSPWGSPDGRPPRPNFPAQNGNDGRPPRPNFPSPNGDEPRFPMGENGPRGPFFHGNNNQQVSQFQNGPPNPDAQRPQQPQNEQFRQMQNSQQFRQPQNNQQFRQPPQNEQFRQPPQNEQFRQQPQNEQIRQRPQNEQFRQVPRRPTPNPGPHPAKFEIEQQQLNDQRFEEENFQNGPEDNGPFQKGPHDGPFQGGAPDGGNPNFFSRRPFPPPAHALAPFASSGPPPANFLDSTSSPSFSTLAQSSIRPDAPWASSHSQAPPSESNSPLQPAASIAVQSLPNLSDFPPPSGPFPLRHFDGPAPTQQALFQPTESLIYTRDFKKENGNVISSTTATPLIQTNSQRNNIPSTTFAPHLPQRNNPGNNNFGMPHAPEGGRWNNQQSTPKPDNHQRQQQNNEQRHQQDQPRQRLPQTHPNLPDFRPADLSSSESIAPTTTALLNGIASHDAQDPSPLPPPPRDTYPSPGFHTGHKGFPSSVTSPPLPLDSPFLTSSSPFPSFRPQKNREPTFGQYLSTTEKQIQKQHPVTTFAQSSTTAQPGGSFARFTSMKPAFHYEIQYQSPLPVIPFASTLAPEFVSSSTRTTQRARLPSHQRSFTVNGLTSTRAPPSDQFVASSTFAPALVPGGGAYKPGTSRILLEMGDWNKKGEGSSDSGNSERSDSETAQS